MADSSSSIFGIALIILATILPTISKKLFKPEKKEILPNITEENNDTMYEEKETYKDDEVVGNRMRTEFSITRPSIKQSETEHDDTEISDDVHCEEIQNQSIHKEEELYAQIDGFDVKKAVIFSEILKTKFEE